MYDKINASWKERKWNFIGNTVRDSLDIQLSFEDNIGNISPRTWAVDNTPVTFRTVYPRLKEILEPKGENVVNNNKVTLSKPFVRGHRKSKFSEKQKQEIYEKYMRECVPKKQLARIYKCCPKTISNIIHTYAPND